MDFLRERNFAGWPFDLKGLDGYERFINRKGPEHEFIGLELEKLRRAFYDSCKRSLGLLAIHTFPVGSWERNSIPEDWEIEQLEWFYKAVSEVHNAADATGNSYDQMVSAARRKLLS